MHQIAIASFTYASDYNGQLPVTTFKDWGGQANLMRTSVFNDLLANYGLAMDMWWCPNNTQFFQDYIDGYPYPGSTWYTDLDGDAYQVVRIGYYYCAGLIPGHQTVGTTPEEVKSPKTLIDPIDWVLCADYMEVLWDGSELKPNTEYPAASIVNHAKQPLGGVEGWLTMIIPDGSNIGLLGGSVSWHEWPEEMEPRQWSHPVFPTATHFW
jgi:hypothetical protein